MSADVAPGNETRRAAVGTALFSAGPLAVVALGPWLLTRWKVQEPVPGGVPAQLAGTLLVAAGAGAVSNSFVRFALEGIGTPAPYRPA